MEENEAAKVGCAHFSIRLKYFGNFIFFVIIVLPAVPGVVMVQRCVTVARFARHEHIILVKVLGCQHSHVNSRVCIALVN